MNPLDTLCLIAVIALVFFIVQKGQLSDRYIMCTSEYLQTLCKWLDRCKLSADAMGPSPFISKVYLHEI